MPSGHTLWQGHEIRLSGSFVGSMKQVVALCPSPLNQQQAAKPLILVVLGACLTGHAAAQGLEVSLRDVLQYLLLQRQLRHQSLQFRVLSLQLLQPFRLIQLQAPYSFLQR